MRITLAEQMWPPPGSAMPAGGEGPINGYNYGETEDYYLTNYDLDGDLDFGDAPSPYPTLLAANGARHYIIPGFSLGAQIDAAADGQPDASALGDDLNPPGGPDDEDGVTFVTALRINTQACVNVFLTGPLGGFLDGWVDFNGNGVWEASEQIFNAQPLLPGLNSGLCFNVPANAQLGTNFARFRLSSGGGLSPTGPAQDGEVEDYQVRICQTAPATNANFTGITVTNAGSQQVIALTWNAETGVRYQVQQTATFSNTPPVIWSDLGSEITGPANSLIITNAMLAERYYRVKVPEVCP